jgi:hypothetical protein
VASFPSAHLNNGVEQYRTLSWIDDMSAELQKRSRFNQDERLVEETRLRGMVTELLLFTRAIRTLQKSRHAKRLPRAAVVQRHIDRTLADFQETLDESLYPSRAPRVASFRRNRAALTILGGRGAEDKGNATGSILGYGVLQVEGFEWYVTACAVGADVFEIAVGDPVVRYGAAGAIVQHQQEDSLAQYPVFGRCADRGSGARCVVIRWIGGGRDRGHFRLPELLGIEFVAHVKRVSAKAEIKRIKVTGAGKKRQEWFEEADLAHAVEEASRGREPRKAVEEETATRAHTRRNQKNFAVGAERE